jgi:hypothetical protein
VKRSGCGKKTMTRDKVQKTFTSNSAPSGKTFRDEKTMSFDELNDW